MAILSDFEEELVLRAQREQEEQQEADRDARIKVALQSVVATHNGRVVLKKIMSLCDPDNSCLRNSPTDTAFNLGVRQVGLSIKDLLGKEAFRAVEDEEI